MDEQRIYRRKLKGIERDLARTGDHAKAISRISWSEDIPIWWLEEFAPEWARQAQQHERDSQDPVAKQEIESQKDKHWHQST